jgi:A/G-specific adenine glycosylase
VLRAWAGLGYNRRARDLHRIARLHRRALPLDPASLDALPGVGAYTAGAVACFAGGRRVAFADTNVRRVLGRMLLGRVATEREAIAIDERLMPRLATDRWHHALMDLGATICAARAPRCDACPMRGDCRSRGRVRPAPPRPQAAFATSDRRVRGRIVALLRERELSVRSLTAAICDERVPRLVEALVADGLVERAGRRVRLPL